MRAFTSVCVLSLITVPLFARAEVPRTISYQGVLREAGGDVVSDGDYEMTFRLYDTPDGPSVLWTETDTVSVSDGVFDVILGGGMPLDLEFDEVYWLGVSVEGGVELTPRVELAASPYAFRAAIADSLVGGGVSDGDWTISGNDVYRTTGSVGIGASAPGDKLHLYEDKNGIVAIRIENPSTGGGSTEGVKFVDENGEQAYIALFDNDFPNYGNAMVIANDRPSGTIRLQTSGFESLRIDNAGNVGIGTTSPSAKLDVEVLTGGAATIGSIGNSATGNYSVALGHQNTAGFASAIAMGQYSEAAGQASIAMGYDTYAGHYAVAMGHGTTASGQSSTAMGRGIEVQGYGSVGVALSDLSGTVVTADSAMVIVGGNVGVGTISPKRSLHISDVARLEPRSGFPSPASDGDLCVVGASGSRHIYCYLNGAWRQLD